MTVLEKVGCLRFRTTKKIWHIDRHCMQPSKLPKRRNETAINDINRFSGVVFHDSLLCPIRAAQTFARAASRLILWLLALISKNQQNYSILSEPSHPPIFNSCFKPQGGFFISGCRAIIKRTGQDFESEAHEQFLFFLTIHMGFRVPRISRHTHSFPPENEP